MILGGGWLAPALPGGVLADGTPSGVPQDAEQRWLAHHDELANLTLVAKTKSWYTGANIEGKQSRLLSYIGGVPAYREACEKVAQHDYEGFELA